MKTLKVMLLAAVAGLPLSLTSSAWADYVSTVLSDNPLGFWRFEDAASSDMASVADSAAGGLSPGVYRNRGGVLPDILLVPGILGQAAQFHGTASGGNGNFIQIYDSAYSTVPYRLESSTTLSLEFWTMSSPTASETYARFISHASGGTANYWVGMTSAGDNPGQPFVGLPGSTWYAWPPNILTDGSWHHVVLTYAYDGANTRGELWIDAISRATSSGAGAFAPPGDWQDLILGAENNPYYVYNGLIGQMDEVAYYNYALSGPQIMAHFNAIPEPGTIALLGLGALLGAAALRRRQAR